MRNARFVPIGLCISLALACSSGGSNGGGGPTDGGAPPMPSSSSPEQAAPALLRSLPVDLAAVDWAAVMAESDLYPGGTPIADFGFVHGEGTSDERRNPQPTFYVPLGTPVLAPIDGVVVAIETLYSGDLTIMYASGPDVRIPIWETEHVEDPLVEVGDTIVAGQPVAVVSDYSCFYSRAQFGNEEWCGRGIGLVELGHLVGGAVPQHFCPFSTDLVDAAAWPTIEAELTAARATVEELAGTTLFDIAAWETPYCIVLEPIEG
jgi:biotin carboxyl carrier protein